MATIINASNSSGLAMTSDLSGTLNLQSNGTTVVTANSSGATFSGYVNSPAQPKFFGYRTAGLVSATTTVLHNVVVTNVGSCYNSSTGIFTCPIAGYYEVFAGGHAENSQPTVMQIQKNNSAIVTEYQNGSGFGSMTVTTIVYCDINDQIKNVIATGTFWGGDISGLRMSVKYLG